LALGFHFGNPACAALEGDLGRAGELLVVARDNVLASCRGLLCERQPRFDRDADLWQGKVSVVNLLQVDKLGDANVMLLVQPFRSIRDPPTTSSSASSPLTQCQHVTSMGLAEPETLPTTATGSYSPSAMRLNFKIGRT